MAFSRKHTTMLNKRLQINSTFVLNFSETIYTEGVRNIIMNVSVCLFVTLFPGVTKQEAL